MAKSPPRCSPKARRVEYAAEFLATLYDKVKCGWCQHPSKTVYRRGLCRHCYSISRQVGKAQATLEESRKLGERVPLTHRLYLELEVKTARKMADLAKSEGQAYGAIHKCQVTGLDVEHQFSLLSRRFLGNDLLFYGDANLFDWAFTLEQKRLIFHLLSVFHREFARRHRRRIASSAAMRGDWTEA